MLGFFSFILNSRANKKNPSRCEKYYILHVIYIKSVLFSQIKADLYTVVLMIGQIASFFLIARALRAASTGAVSVGLVYHTLKNYKLCHLDT